MIKAEITKNVMNKSTSLLNFSKKQLVIFAIGCAAGLGSYFGLKPYLPSDVIMWLVFLEAILIIGFGVVRINGMSLFAYMASTTKKHDRRYYSKENFIYVKK